MWISGELALSRSHFIEAPSLENLRQNVCARADVFQNLRFQCFGSGELALRTKKFEKTNFDAVGRWAFEQR